MNLFDQITGKSSVQGFLGNKSPETPSFMQPALIAPRTPSYTAPVQKPYSLFSDEQAALDKMTADNIPHADAMEAIKSRRKDLLGGDPTVSQFELQALKKMQADGLSATEATQALVEHRKAMQEEAQKKYASMGTTEKLVKGAVGASLGAVSTIGSSAENILGWGAKKIGFDTLGNELQQNAQEWKRASADLGKSPEYSAGVTTGNIVGGAGMLAAAPGPTGLLGEGAGIGAKVLAGAGEGAMQSAGMDIASQGNTSLKSTLVGGAVGGTLPLVGATYGAAKKYLTDKLPKSLISSGLMTPSKLLNASERLSRLSDEGIVDASSAPQWLLDKGIQGGKENIKKQLSAIAKDASKQKVQLFAQDLENGVVKTYESAPAVKDLQQALIEVLPNFAKVTKDEIIPKAGNADKVTAILEFVTKPKPTALDIDKARAVLGDMGIFTKGGDLVDSATKEGLQKVWIDASKLLDESLPGFRNLNKDIEVSNAMGKALGLKEAQDSVRQLMTLTNAGMGGIGATYGYAKEGDFAGAAKGAALGLGAKYLLNNPAVTSFIAQKLNSLGKPGIVSGIIKSPVTQKLIRSEVIKKSK